VVDDGGVGMPRSGYLQKGERQLGEDGQRDGGRRRKNGVRMGVCVDAAKAGVDLGGVLDGLQIVSDGDDGKQDEDEHGQGDPLGPPASACPRSKAHPEAKDHDGRKRPHEIED